MTESNSEIKIRNALENGAVMIYGAHLVAAELYRYLRFLNKDFKFAGFVVTAAEGNPTELEGEIVTELKDSKAASDTTVMIAMPQKYHKEAEEYARIFGFSTFIKISLEEMSDLKGKLILDRYQRDKNVQFHLYKDAYDTSWLNMTDSSDRSIKGQEAGQRHYKFPTLYYLTLETMFHEAEKFDFYRDYERIFGTYHNVHRFPYKNTAGNASEKFREYLNIYMVFSQWDSKAVLDREFPPWICPIQAGSILTENKAGEYLDETGDSISEKNNILAEMTAAYWIWKNGEPAKYKGLCHYRRHFVLTGEEVMSLDANGIDVILTAPRYAPGGVGKMFLAETPVKEPVYHGMLKAVAECHSEDGDAFKQYMEDCMYCPNNMVVARSRIYDAYCQWIFPVLFRMMEIDAENGYGHKNDRHIAYAAELLTSYFFSRHKEGYTIAVTDYKFYS